MEQIKPVKPVSEVLLKHKEYQSIEEFAATLEKIAAKLRAEGKFTFVQGEEQIIVEPTGQLKVEYEYTKKADKHKFEIEFEWLEGTASAKRGDMSIE